MSTVIEQVETEHRALETAMAALDAAISSHHVDDATVALSRLQALLTLHFALETEQLYPALLARAKSTPSTYSLVSMFASNLGRIAAGAMAFLERWNRPLSVDEMATLAAEWRTIHHILVSRVQDEEKVLHPIYGKLFQLGSHHS